jgi:transposase
MSKSLLYHGFGLKGVEYRKTEYRDGSIYFHIETDSKHLECSSCKSKKVVKKGKKERTFRTVSIGFKPVFMVAHIHRLECKECGVIRQEEIKYADKKKLIPTD